MTDEDRIRSARDMWVTMARHSRTVTPQAFADQCDAMMRDYCDALDVDVHDPAQRHAVQMGVVLVLANIGPSAGAQLAANVLAPLLSPWWEGARP